MRSTARLPEFVTFTGADDATDVDGMLALAARYPIEWGILFSPKRQGVEPRYPARPDRFTGRGLRLAAHLCGAHSRSIMDGAMFEPPFTSPDFVRVQVNHPAPHPDRIAAFQRWVGRRCIAQARGAAFPADDSIDRLFDASGGRGIAPAAWPPHPGWRIVGYAGGITPESVREVIAAIGATGPYWIDMESGVRTDDRFDLEKCRRVCELVYGAAAPSGKTPHELRVAAETDAAGWKQGVEDANRIAQEHAVRADKAEAEAARAREDENRWRDLLVDIARDADLLGCTLSDLPQIMREIVARLRVESDAAREALEEAARRLICTVGRRRCEEYADSAEPCACASCLAWQRARAQGSPGALASTVPAQPASPAAPAETALSPCTEEELAAWERAAREAGEPMRAWAKREGASFTLAALDAIPSLIAEVRALRASLQSALAAASATQAALAFEAERLARWQIEVAEGLGYVNRPDGQSGCEVAEPAVIVAAWREAEQRIDGYSAMCAEQEARAAAAESREAALRAALAKELPEVEYTLTRLVGNIDGGWTGEPGRSALARIRAALSALPVEPSAPPGVAEVMQVYGVAPPGWTNGDCAPERLSKCPVCENPIHLVPQGTAHRHCSEYVAFRTGETIPAAFASTGERGGLRAEPCCTHCKRAGLTECACPIAKPLPYGPVGPVCRWPVPMKQREWENLNAWCDRISDKMIAGRVRGLVSMLATAEYEVATLRRAARARSASTGERGARNAHHREGCINATPYGGGRECGCLSRGQVPPPRSSGTTAASEGGES